jgi:hypothetical protein
LVGYGGGLVNPLKEEVKVFDPQFCNPTAQSFCTIFPTNEKPCDALYGSPLIAGFAFFGGFLLNNQVCSLHNKGFMLNYHPLNDYIRFIEESSTEELASNDLPKFVVNLVTFNHINDNKPVFQCSGTIISKHHVLTTAMCASIRIAAVQSTFVDSENEFEEVVRITIHPEFKANQSLTNNNIAIIKVRKKQLKKKFKLKFLFTDKRRI